MSKIEDNYIITTCWNEQNSSIGKIGEIGEIGNSGKICKIRKICWVAQIRTAFESGKFIVGIHLTLPSNFNFLHHNQILNCLQTIDKYRKVHARLCTLCSHACTYCSISANNFNFLHHPKILQSLTDMVIFLNMHANIYLHSAFMCIVLACMHISLQ